MKVDFYNAVKAAQRAQKINSDVLAEKIGISLSTLSRKVRNPRTLTIEEFTRLSRVLWNDADASEALAGVQKGIRVV